MAKFIKTIEIGDQTITLKHNALTYVKYKNFTSRDMLADTMKLGMKTKQEQDIIIKATGDFDSLTAEEKEILSCALLDANMGEFLLNVTAALVSTAEYPKNRPLEEIIDDLPDDIMVNKQFMKEISEFLMVNVENIKKNIVKAR